MSTWNAKATRIASPQIRVRAINSRVLTEATLAVPGGVA